ncbi:restriction endonuclease subunit S [Fusobacterium polymorphum]|uniref:restriction endonuclease subunit S n=1 Tax=Fusobacterium nucleatum subsp. polymorphum TaxID=76857 RepID=UPI0030CE6498
MSKLDELIKELCPNGVEYKELKDLCIISRGKIISKDYIRDNPGNFPVYSSQTENEGNLGNISTYDYDGEYLTWTTDGANAGTVFYRNTKFNITNVCGLLKIKVEKITSKFLYYFLVIKAPEYVNRGMGNPKLMSNVMERIKVPLPPLEVQNEIVKILDNYTKSIKELKEKINKELVARKKQYSWYRDYLLKFENKVKMVKIGDLFEFKNGINKDKSSFGKGTPIINYVNVYKKNKIYFEDLKGLVEASNDELVRYGVKRGDVFFTRTSETIEEIGYTSVLLEDIENCVFSGFLLRARPITDLLLPEYCAYCFSTSNIRNAIIKKSTYTTRALTNGTSLSQIEIPLPSLEVQKRIVEVLDNFEKICNDLNIGLPTEIEARQKQYEFYRNFLLTFKIKNYTLPKTRQDKTRQDIIKLFMYIFGYINIELGEILRIKNGSDYKKFNIGNVPVYGSGGIINYIDTYIYDKESVLIPRKGSIGNLFYVDKPFWTVDTIFYTVIDKEVVIPKYVYYYLSKVNLEKLNTAGGVPSLTQTVLNKILISLPSLEEQQRIVDILDRFDKLCNDISEGLPAEIEARQKQYEYFREKLLTFKNIND